MPDQSNAPKHGHEQARRQANARFAASANLKFTIDKPSPYSTALQLIDAEQDFIIVESVNPPSNPFGTNMLYVFVTQQGGISLPGTPAIASASANARGQTMIPAGSASFGQSPYLIAYSLNPATTSSGTTIYGDVAATAYIPSVPVPDDQVSEIAYAQSTLSISSIQGFFITFLYNFPPGIDPTAGGAGDGAWIGVWKGHVQNPYVTAPDASGSIGNSQNSGSWPVSLPFPIATSGPYTAALFTSGWTTNPANLPKNNVAAWIYFSTHGPI